MSFFKNPIGLATAVSFIIFLYGFSAWWSGVWWLLGADGYRIMTGWFIVLFAYALVVGERRVTSYVWGFIYPKLGYETVTGYEHELTGLFVSLWAYIALVSLLFLVFPSLMSTREKEGPAGEGVVMAKSSFSIVAGWIRDVLALALFAMEMYAILCQAGYISEADHLTADQWMKLVGWGLIVLLVLETGEDLRKPDTFYPPFLPAIIVGGLINAGFFMPEYGESFGQVLTDPVGQLALLALLGFYLRLATRRWFEAGR